MLAARLHPHHSSLQESLRGSCVPRPPTAPGLPRPNSPRLHGEARAAAEQKALTARARLRDAEASGDWDACRQALDDMLRVESGSVAYAYRSAIALKQQLPERSLDDADAAIEAAPYSPRGYYRQGRVLSRLGRYAEASHAFADSISLNETDRASRARFDDQLASLRRDRCFFDASQSSRGGAASTPTTPRGATSRPRYRTIGTPPPSATEPSACVAPSLAVAAPTALRVTWRVVSDDGGDEPHRYELQAAPVDAEGQPGEYESAFSGLGRWSFELTGLVPDSAYSIRVAAVNGIGRGEWSAALLARTLPQPIAASSSAAARGAGTAVVGAPTSSGGGGDAAPQLPHGWQPLQARLLDLLRSAAPSSAAPTPALSSATPVPPTAPLPATASPAKAGKRLDAAPADGGARGKGTKGAKGAKAARPSQPPPPKPPPPRPPPPPPPPPSWAHLRTSLTSHQALLRSIYRIYSLVGTASGGASGGGGGGLSLVQYRRLGVDCHLRAARTAAAAPAPPEPTARPKSKQRVRMAGAPAAASAARTPSPSPAGRRLKPQATTTFLKPQASASRMSIGGGESPTMPRLSRSKTGCVPSTAAQLVPAAAPAAAPDSVNDDEEEGGGKSKADDAPARSSSRSGGGSTDASYDLIFVKVFQDRQDAPPSGGDATAADGAGAGEASPRSCDASPSPRRAPAGRGGGSEGATVDAAADPTDGAMRVVGGGAALSELEFVEAIVRVAWVRYAEELEAEEEAAAEEASRSATPRARPTTPRRGAPTTAAAAAALRLAECVERLVLRKLAPYATFEPRDELTLLCGGGGGGARALLGAHEAAVGRVYEKLLAEPPRVNPEDRRKARLCYDARARARGGGGGEGGGGGGGEVNQAQVGLNILKGLSIWRAKVAQRRAKEEPPPDPEPPPTSGDAEGGEGGEEGEGEGGEGEAGAQADELEAPRMLTTVALLEALHGLRLLPPPCALCELTPASVRAQGEDAAEQLQLSLDEFCEVLARCCCAALPRGARCEPFEATLQGWVGHFVRAMGGE